MRHKAQATSATARSWSELAQTLHEGFAVLDTDARLIFASDRFLSALGQPDDLVGHAAEGVLPALSDDDPRQLRRRLEAGDQIDFVQQVLSVEGESHWYRVTGVPSNELGPGLSCVLFARDISPESRRLKQLREATIELTEVEIERHRRATREIHDGPVQLLAALIFRLGMIEDPAANHLQQAVTEVAHSLRTAIEDLTSLIDHPGGPLFEQWISPVLVDGRLQVEVHDHRSSERGLAEAHAAFTLLYQSVRAMREATSQRTLTMHVTDDEDRECIALRVPATRSSALTDKQLVRVQAITQHAETLGGWLTEAFDDDDRIYSMWIPKSTHRAPTVLPTATPESHDLRPSQNDITALPPLSDAAWLQIVGAAPVRMAEIDGKMNITFVNTRMKDGLGDAAKDLVGSPAKELLKLGVVDEFEQHRERLIAGESVSATWYRTDQPGKPDRVRVNVAPRLTNGRDLDGLLISTSDRSDIRLLDELHEEALTDVALARRFVINTSIERVSRPLTDCERLIEHIEHFEQSSSESEAIRTIRKALEAGLRSIQTSSSVFTTCPLSADELGPAIQQSLGTILDGRRLVVVDNTTTPPPAETSHAVFRIAREAANNAVLHGDASTITITLSDTETGTSCTIHDDGIGLDADQLGHQPGHLGIRSMQARAREQGGSFSIEPHPTVGTLVSVRLPTEPNRRTLVDEQSSVH